MTQKRKITNKNYSKIKKNVVVYNSEILNPYLHTLNVYLFVFLYNVFYHLFFASSILAPPGPKATTNNKPPMTDMVWKKSYLRKSRMAFH